MHVCIANYLVYFTCSGEPKEIISSASFQSGGPLATAEEREINCLSMLLSG